ncbi:ribosomal L29e protein family-domain-containing protein, partial [Endogone sp. FLAS-F59071]
IGIICDDDVIHIIKLLTISQVDSWDLPFESNLVRLYIPTSAMSKSKNHTNHNQNKKAHRNGIKKPKTNTYPSLKGVKRVYCVLCQVEPKFLRNQRFAKGNARKIVPTV